MCVCVRVFVCLRAYHHSNIFSFETGPIEAKFHAGIPCDYCHSLVNVPGPGAFSRDFTINLSPQCRAYSRALQIEVPAIPRSRTGQDYK